MENLKFSDVVLTLFPFSSQSQSKPRPAVVVSSDVLQALHGDVILLAITSKIWMPKDSTSFIGNLQIADWEQAGLLKPSLFKPALVTLEYNNIDQVIGKLSQRDMVTLKELLSRMFVLT